MRIIDVVFSRGYVRYIQRKKISYLENLAKVRSLGIVVLLRTRQSQKFEKNRRDKLFPSECVPKHSRSCSLPSTEKSHREIYPQLVPRTRAHQSSWENQREVGINWWHILASTVRDTAARLPPSWRRS